MQPVPKRVPDAEFEPTPVLQLRAGQRIEHNRFGYGVINEITGNASDLKAKRSVFKMGGGKGNGRFGLFAQKRAARLDALFSVLLFSHSHRVGTLFVFLLQSITKERVWQEVLKKSNAFGRKCFIL